MLAGLACVIAAILASFATWNLKPSSPVVPHPISRFEITLPAGQRLAGPDQPVVALSPDGKTLVYAASGEGAQQLYLRPMDSIEAKPIPGTQEATTPFFSPDGQWVGFIAGGKLQKVSIRGGPPAIINDGVVTGGASWGDQGIIAFTPRPLTTVAQIRELSGPAQPLTHVDIAETHRWPFLTGRTALFFDVAPDGKRFLMLKPVEKAQAAAQINVVLNWFSELQQRVPVK